MTLRKFYNEAGKECWGKVIFQGEERGEEYRVVVIGKSIYLERMIGSDLLGQKIWKVAEHASIKVHMDVNIKGLEDVKNLIEKLIEYKKTEVETE